MSTPAMSTPAFLTVPRCPLPRFQSSRLDLRCFNYPYFLLYNLMSCCMVCYAARQIRDRSKQMEFRLIRLITMMSQAPSSRRMNCCGKRTLSNIRTPGAILWTRNCASRLRLPVAVSELCFSDDRSWLWDVNSRITPWSRITPCTYINTINVKGKPIAELQSVTCRTESHTESPATQYRWTRPGAPP